jgi:hypothetical protein
MIARRDAAGHALWAAQNAADARSAYAIDSTVATRLHVEG